MKPQTLSILAMVFAIISLLFLGLEINFRSLAWTVFGMGLGFFLITKIAKMVK